MRTHLGCVKCLTGLAVEAVRAATADEALRRRAIAAALAEIARHDHDLPPPTAGGHVQAAIARVTGVDDPYRGVKVRSNDAALAQLDALADRVARAADPFDAATRLALAGNVLDFDLLGAEDRPIALAAAAEAALAEPLAIDGVAALERAAERAHSILYLADNAGEIAWDRLLVDRLPRDRVTVAVKGGPALNDATIEDAERVGMTARCEVVSTGSRFPGTILETCSDRFRERFAAADLIVSKGQANYETLTDARPGIFFLLKAKCGPVARELGVAQGSWIVLAT